MAAFAEAQIVSDFTSGAVAVAQSHGIGRLEANTVLMGWSGTPAGRPALLTVLGMQRPTEGDDAYGERLDALADAVGTVLLVHNGHPEEVAL